MSDSIAAFHSLRRITCPGKSSVSAYLSEVWPTHHASTSALGRNILRLYLIHAPRASRSYASARTLPTATGRIPKAVFSSHITASWCLNTNKLSTKNRKSATIDCSRAFLRSITVSITLALRTAPPIWRLRKVNTTTDAVDVWNRVH